MPNKLHKKCSGWCWPTLLYIAFSVIGLVTILSGNGLPYLTTRSLVGNLVIQLIWVAILYALCSNCKSNIAWFIILLPVIILFIIGLLFIGLIRSFPSTTSTYSPQSMEYQQPPQLQYYDTYLTKMD